ncbi:MAG: hypothetical protein N4A46_10265 [Schleiferiaceae bacterium]|jgi:hypothetical protein|nr:hypothetical protein [Schleiferiaceae bacterium]
MIRRIPLLGLLLALLACNKEDQKSVVPAYLHIEAMRVDADFNSQGTEHHKLTTGWVFVNDDVLGAFEFPVDIPIAASGPTKIRVEPGMNLNGIKALRTLYPFHSPYEETIDLVPEQLHYLNSNNDSLAVSTYEGTLSLNVIEDFESPGLSLEPTDKSDTTLVKVNASQGAFVFKNEPTTSGKAVIQGQGFFEVVTTDKFDFTPVPDYYVELTYKSELPFTVGVFMTTQSQTIQAPVVQVSPSEEWNKIYINLVTEVGQTQPDNYKLFIGAVNTTNSAKELYIDNLKLLY